MMRLLGIDHGEKRIGLAVSDATGLVARELSILRHVSHQKDLERINNIAAEQGVVAIVVGVPTNIEGADTQAKMVLRWVEQLAAATSLPIILWDEQLTSAEARELARRQRRKVGAPIDDLAARVMLQSYLDAVRDGLASFPVTEP